MVALGADIGSGVDLEGGRSRNSITFSGATVTVSTVFRLIASTPINSSTARVFFSREPKHVSPLATTDVLYLPNWSIALSAGTLGTTEPIVTGVDNVRRALATEVDLTAYPEAHSVDVQFDRRIIWNATYLITAAAQIQSQDLVNNLVDASNAVPPQNERSFPGIHIQRPRRVTRAVRTRTGVDLAYNTFSGLFEFEANNDLANQSGNAALKKRIIRRLLSSPGGFPHLPEYGVGLRQKEALKTTTIAELRLRIQDQVALEPEVERAQVDLSRPEPNTLVVVLHVITTASSSFPLRFNVPSEGPIRVAA